MNAWKGKLIGFLLGLLTRRLQFMLLGLAIGHLYDMGLFTARRGERTPEAPQPDPYAVLGVAEDALMDEIDAAYRRRMSDYHPDKVANAAAEIKALAETRAREINAAYEAIRKRRQGA